MKQIFVKKPKEAKKMFPRNIGIIAERELEYNGYYLFILDNERIQLFWSKS